MQWPWRRFEAFYIAHCKRLEVQRITEVKNAMIAGLWANSNLDDGTNTRQNALIEIETSYQDQLLAIYNSDLSEEDEIDFMDQPFFKAMNFDWELEE